jgi:hypothetical protein
MIHLGVVISDDGTPLPAGAVQSHSIIVHESRFDAWAMRFFKRVLEGRTGLKNRFKLSLHRS